MDDELELAEQEWEAIRKTLPPSSPHTLWRGEVLLGDVDLYPLHDAKRSGFSGVLRPAPAYETIRPLVDAFSAASAAFLEGMRSFTGPVTGPRSFDHIAGSAAFREAAAAIEQLALIVHDAEGRPLERAIVSLQHPYLPHLDERARQAIKAGTTEMQFLSMLDPDGVLVSVLQRAERSTPPGNSPGGSSMLTEGKPE